MRNMIVPDRDWQELVEDELGRVGGGSSAWLNMLRALGNADDAVAEGQVEFESAAYWSLAWVSYESLQDDLYTSEEDRRLGQAYNLDELHTCHWCLSHVLEPLFVDDGHTTPRPYHMGCLIESARQYTQELADADAAAVLAPTTPPQGAA